MKTRDKVERIRNLMLEEGIDAYIINDSDPHMSEYLPEHFKFRQWVSGFTGSFGNIVITQTKAGLWTDSRYFIQAEKELEGTGIDIYKLNIPNQIDIQTWLQIELKEGQKVGLDGYCMGIAEVKSLKDTLNNKNVEVLYNINLITSIWEDRPPLPKDEIIEHTIKRSGESRISKLTKVRDVMINLGVDYHFVSSLDDIAWILNIRGNDISYNPVVLSYLLISETNTTLFIDSSKVTFELKKQLYNDGINIEEYNQVVNVLLKIQDTSIFLIDPLKTNYAIYKAIAQHHNIYEAENPSILMKAIKNKTEIEGMRMACIKDGVALTEFWYWLENNIEQQYTEFDLAKKLISFRVKQDNYINDSFGAIVAYKENAALPHYSASSSSCLTVRKEGLLLIDSGGQYLEGTTDITRTMPVGKLSQEEKDDYTLVLKGMIQLSMLKFPKGTKGCNIDIVARKSLWNVGMDYGHGTGHGIGSYLNVHEGPQSIRQDLKDQPIVEGMITSNEPGIYKEKRHGIRHENIILCKKDKTTEFGEFLCFETITMFYFDTTALNTELLDPKEIEWLNCYHKNVFSKLSPLLDQKHIKWLKNKTKFI